MGKGSKRRKGDDAEAYREWYDEYEKNSNISFKKTTDCWKCNISFKCHKKYIEIKCPIK